MEKFTTYITFTSGDSYKEEPITIEQVTPTIQRLMRGPAAMTGMISEVKIVDAADCIVFHAKKPENTNLPKVLFPVQDPAWSYSSGR